MQGYCDSFVRIILKQMSIDAHLHAMSSRHKDTKFEHFDVRNPIYHKISHSLLSIGHMGKNLNFMLKFRILIPVCNGMYFIIMSISSVTTGLQQSLQDQHFLYNLEGKVKTVNLNLFDATVTELRFFKHQFQFAKAYFRYSISLYHCLILICIKFILKERRLHWYGHVECSNSAVKAAFDIQVDGKRGPGRTKMT